MMIGEPPLSSSSERDIPLLVPDNRIDPLLGGAEVYGWVCQRCLLDPWDADPEKP